MSYFAMRNAFRDHTSRSQPLHSTQCQEENYPRSFWKMRKKIQLTGNLFPQFMNIERINKKMFE